MPVVAVDFKLHFTVTAGEKESYLSALFDVPLYMVSASVESLRVHCMIIVFLINF